MTRRSEGDGPAPGAGMAERLVWARRVLAEEGEPRTAAAAAVVLELVDRLEAMLEHTSDLITVLGADGTIRYSNRAAGLLTGHGEEVNGTSALDLIHPDDVAAAAAAFDACVATAGAEVSVEMRLRRADGSWRVMDAYARNCLGEPVAGVVVSMRDVTERKAAEAALVAANDKLRASLARTERVQMQLLQRERMAAIGELASTMGHELRNPLGVLTNSLYLLRRRVPAGDVRAVRHLDTAEREVAAAGAIVSDLLEFAQAREPVPAVVDVADLVGEVLGVVPPPVGVGVEWEPPAQTPVVVGDRHLLRQALVNLVRNALDAMPDGGVLTLTVAAAPGGGQRIRVADTGAGMDAHTVSRAFEPFYSNKVKGVGLGLAVVQRIIAAHGGAVAVDSRPGAGTTVTVDLPDAGPRL